MNITVNLDAAPQRIVVGPHRGYLLSAQFPDDALVIVLLTPRDDHAGVMAALDGAVIRLLPPLTPLPETTS